jgi:predicted transcriptional regulator
MADVSILRRQVKKFIETANEKELAMAFHLFNAAKDVDWWDEIDVAHKKAIDKGLEQLDSGQGVNSKSVMKKYNKWLAK